MTWADLDREVKQGVVRFQVEFVTSRDEGKRMGEYTAFCAEEKRA